MVEVLVIPDGAAEVPGPEPTSLELARTPAIDVLCERGAVVAAAVIPAGLAPGSEAGIPTLLGAPPREPLSRGAIEAASYEIVLPPGHSAWRCDLNRWGRRYRPSRPDDVAGALESSAAGARAHHLRGHRFLLVARRRPAPRVVGIDLRVWGEGAVPARALDGETAIVCGPGAAAGIGRLLGARVVVPAGTTGAQDTDLAAKREAALAELARARRVVVHVGAADEAAHERDRAGKIAAIEAIDAEIVAPLAAAALAAGGRIAVCPDHGTDPATGAHLAGPVPRVDAGEGIASEGPSALAERHLVGEPEAVAL